MVMSLSTTTAPASGNRGTSLHPDSGPRRPFGDDRVAGDQIRARADSMNHVRLHPVRRTGNRACRDDIPLDTHSTGHRVYVDVRVPSDSETVPGDVQIHFAIRKRPDVEKGDPHSVLSRHSSDVDIVVANRQVSREIFRVPGVDRGSRGSADKNSKSRDFRRQRRTRLPGLRPRTGSSRSPDHQTAKIQMAAAFEPDEVQSLDADAFSLRLYEERSVASLLSTASAHSHPGLPRWPRLSTT